MQNHSLFLIFGSKLNGSLMFYFEFKSHFNFIPFDNLGDREFQFQKSPSKTSLSDFIIFEKKH